MSLNRFSEEWARWFAPPVRPWVVIVTAVIPFWIYLTGYDIVIYESYVLAGTSREAIATPWTRTVQHALLLPFVLLTYRYAWNIGWPERDRVDAVARHIVVAFAVSSLARLAMNCAIWLVTGFEEDKSGWAVYHLEPTAFEEGMMWYFTETPALFWRATAEFFFVYWFGMALIVGLVFALQLRDEKVAASRLREDWLKARLDSLAGQLNPHFLFNSLNTVSSFVRANPDRAETILADLSQLLRTSLRERARPLVAVAEELEFIERYLAIERTRFEDRLRADIEADAETLNARMPSLLLQPLVENAIKHGVSRSRGPATLKVSVTRAGEQLRLLVENTFRPVDGNAPDGENVGVSNVRERLEALYGARARFEAGPVGEVWRVVIELPWEQGVE
jgi:hypothetical protein